MTLSVGRRLGPYEVISLLGAGGMGEVYRARDTRLDRTVAVKVLPAHLGQEPERRARFEREARAASALNHPQICTLHDIGHQDGADYLVLEYLEGETLGDRLERGALPLEQALRLGAEIADALDKAHRAGIVHRDVKPGNVVLTRSGAKLLDFGLARVAGEPEATGAVSTAPTGVKPLTEAGTLLGTYQYMAPEQLEGKEADARTDVFALGSVLYEMVTGRRAFEGKSQASLIGAILKDEPPPMRELKPLTPLSLERVVRACLAKDPDDRWQSAHDVASELRWIGERRDELPTKPRGRLRAVWLVFSGAVGALVVAGLVWLAQGRSAGVRAPTTHQVSEAVRFTHEAGLFESPSWSADGKLVAFASNRTGNFEVYVRRVDGGQEINVTEHPSEDIQPAFSPDGRSIAFVSTRASRTGVVRVGQTLGLEYRVFGGDLWITPALGGNARRLAADANYPAWRPDGRAILYVSGSEDQRSLKEVSPDGSSVREVLPGARSRWEITRPHYSPDGLWISLEGADGEVFVLPAGEGEPHPLLGASDHAWADDGSLFFLRRGAAGGSLIGRVTVDRRSGLVTGPEEVAAVLTGALGDLSVAPGSQELAVAEIEAGFNLTRLPLSPDGSRPAGPEQALSSGSVRDRYPTYSSDGRRLAYSSNRSGRLEVWVLDLETMRQARMPMPQEGLETYSPGWLADGNTLVAMGGQARRRAVTLAAIGRRQPCRAAAGVPQASTELRDHQRLARWSPASPAADGGVRHPALRARPRHEAGAAPDGDARQQVRRRLVTRRPEDRLLGQHGRDPPALDAAGRGRRGPAAHVRQGAHAPRLLLARREVDLHPAEPPQRLPCSRDRRSAAASHDLSGVGPVPGGADPVARRSRPRLLALAGRSLALAPAAGRAGSRRRRALTLDSPASRPRMKQYPTDTRRRLGPRPRDEAGILRDRRASRRRRDG
jgi:serine/threonine protein kinase/Tol biopolymer transport system component